MDCGIPALAAGAGGQVIHEVITGQLRGPNLTWKTTARAAILPFVTKKMVALKRPYVHYCTNAAWKSPGATRVRAAQSRP